MPFKSEKILIAGTQYDRRIKLTATQKKYVKYAYEIGISIHQISRMYKVSRRLIQFVIFPKRLELSKLNRKQRGGSKIYYRKEANTLTQREHRSYKQKLYIQKLINKPPEETERNENHT